MVGLIGSSSGSSSGTGGGKLGSSMLGRVFPVEWECSLPGLLWVRVRGFEEVLQAVTAGSCRSLNFFEPHACARL
jgi:hypothetical protein